MAFSIEVIEKKFSNPTEGPHVARLYQIIDLGQHDFQGDGKFKRRAFLNFELPDELMDDGRPHSIGLEVSLIFVKNSPKAVFPKLVAALVGRKLTDNDIVDVAKDISQLVGKACAIEVANKKTAKGDEWASIVSFMSLRKHEVVPPAINTPLLFSLEDGVNSEKLRSIPEFIKKKINFGA